MTYVLVIVRPMQLRAVIHAIHFLIVGMNNSLVCGTRLT